MKTVVLIRHAKTHTESASGRDYDRTLQSRGMQDAIAMSKRLFELGLLPECLISSTAIRAQSTAELIKTDFPNPVPIVYAKELYSGFPDAYLQAIHSADEHYGVIGIIGHNPAITLLANSLASDNVTDSMQTCSVISLEFENAQSWADIQVNKGICKQYLFPKQTS